MHDTREKLIELIACDVPKHETFMYKIFERLADHLIANGVTVQEWIPVSERLPALHTDDYEELDGGRVQIEVSDDQWVTTRSGYQTKARYETDVVFQGWVGEFGETVRDVTHWMPLPQPLKGE